MCLFSQHEQNTLYSATVCLYRTCSTLIVHSRYTELVYDSTTVYSAVPCTCTLQFSHYVLNTRSLNSIDIRIVFNLGGHKYTFYSKLPKYCGGRAPWSLCVDAHACKYESNNGNSLIQLGACRVMRAA